MTFAVRYRHQIAEFTIEDTGVGIRQGDLERIFQPFERASTGGSLVTTGTGLGLTITSLLTKIMGGDISVSSEVGEGQRLPRQALSVGGIKSAHRLYHGIQRSRLHRARARRLSSSMIMKYSAI